MAIYLVHFDKPYKHAKHYLGFVDTAAHDLSDALTSRMEYHRRGAGSKLLRAVNSAGIDWRVVRVWPEGSRVEERRLKIMSSTRLCPICNPRFASNGPLTGSLVDAALIGVI